MGAAREAVPGGLSLSELCDVVYVLLLERLERHAALSVASAAAGAQEFLDFSFASQDLDEWLTSTALQVDPEEAELRHALGLR